MSSDSANPNLEFFHYLPDSESTVSKESDSKNFDLLEFDFDKTYSNLFNKNLPLISSFENIIIEEETNVIIESLSDFIKDLNIELSSKVNLFTFQFKNTTMETVSDTNEIFEELSVIKSNINTHFFLQDDEAKRFIENMRNPDPNRKEVRKKTIERIRNKYKTGNNLWARL